MRTARLSLVVVAMAGIVGLILFVTGAVASGLLWAYGVAYIVAFPLMVGSFLVVMVGIALDSSQRSLALWALGCWACITLVAGAMWFLILVEQGWAGSEGRHVEWSYGEGIAFWVIDVVYLASALLTIRLGRRRRKGGRPSLRRCC